MLRFYVMWGRRYLVLTAAMGISCGGGYASLKAEDVDKVMVTTVAKDSTFCAYSPAKLRAVVQYKDGKQVGTQALGEKKSGRLRTSEFKWSSNRGTIDGDATLLLNKDTLSWFGKLIRVNAQVIASPNLQGESVLHPRFDCQTVWDLRGAPGARGGEAENGNHGNNGPKINIALAYLDTQSSAQLVLLRITLPEQDPQHYIFQPKETPVLTIDARGGNGGAGGQGYIGWDGRPGSQGADGLNCGDGGQGGPGGDGTGGGPGARGGNGGAGGMVTLSYDARFPQLLDLVRVRIEGGKPGAGGKGGKGGASGPGGPGGSGDKMVGPNGEAVADCAGANGSQGPNGKSGSHGPDGESGQPGKPGRIVKQPAPVTSLFAKELSKGVPLQIHQEQP